MLPTKESLTVEFKSDRKKLSDADIFEAVVAFANTQGGELYLGIEDSGEVTGVHKAHENSITVSAFIANNTVPPVSVRAEMIEDIHPVLKITVPKSYGGIVATVSGKTLHRRLKADGTPENVAMYPTEFVTRLSDLRLLDYSAMPLAQSDMGAFDPLEIERLRRAILSYHGDKSLLELADEDLCKALGLVREQEGRLCPTVTGLLLVGKTEEIKRYIPTHQAAFQVMEGTKIISNEDYVLPLLNMIERLVDRLDVWNKEQEIDMGVYRLSAPDFERRAVREAIVNAFSHRDYTRLGRVRVALGDTGLIIASPGGFVDGISVNNLLSAEPHGRNPQLADALKRIGLAERTGRGIDRIYEGSLIFGRPAPDYSASTDVTVSVLIARSQPDKQIARMVSDEQKRLGRPLSVDALLVLNLLRDHPRSTVRQLAGAGGLSDTVVRSQLDAFVEAGLAQPFESGRGQTYMLAASVYSAKGKRSGLARKADVEEARYPELILEFARSNEFIARADVMQLLHVSSSKAYSLLKRMVADGLLEAVNKGHYAKYRCVQ